MPSGVQNRRCHAVCRELDPLQVSVWIAEQTDALVD